MTVDPQLLANYVLVPLLIQTRVQDYDKQFRGGNSLVVRAFLFKHPRRLDETIDYNTILCTIE